MKPILSKDSFDRFQRPMSILAATLVLSAGAAAPAMAGEREFSWLGGDGIWLSNDWLLDGVPALFPPATFGVQNDIVRIGNLPGVQNSTVQLGFFDGEPFSVVLSRAEISHGMTLDLSGSRMLTTNGLSLEGGSRLLVRPTTPLFSGYSGRVDISSDSQMELFAGSEVALVGSASVNWGLISGRGKVVYLPSKGGAGTSGLINNGTISGLDNGGLWLQQLGSGRLDLDGSTGNGQVQLASPFAQLRIQGDQLTDSFSGAVTMGTGALLDVDLSNGWTADAQSTLNVAGGVANTAAQIDGGHFTFGGDLNIGGTHGYLRVLADTTLASSTDVLVGNSDRLEFDGQAEIQGGVYQVAQAGRIDFDGSTDVGGGVFNMAGNSVSDGVVNFNGDTDWHGTVTINGAARQNGDAVVSGGLGAVINAAKFDMDGESQHTHWDINSGLVINADTISANDGNGFNGSIDIRGGFTSKLTINLSEGAWNNYGETTLTGDPTLYLTRIAGSGMQLFGDLTVRSGRVRIDAELLIASSSSVSFDQASAVLMTTSQTWVQSNAQFIGSGMLRNGSAGEMIFSNGVDLGDVGFRNDGRFRIGHGDGAVSSGVATVSRFENSASATWALTLGGYLAGDEFDFLKVSGDAILAGTLEVSLADLGAGLFAPNIGDEFLILSAFGSVSGTFLNDPFTIVGPLTYEWEVLYNPNSVVLRLENIVPAPGSVALLALGSLTACSRRRRGLGGEA